MTGLWRCSVGEEICVRLSFMQLCLQSRAFPFEELYPHKVPSWVHSDTLREKHIYDCCRSRAIKLCKLRTTLWWIQRIFALSSLLFPGLKGIIVPQLVCQPESTVQSGESAASKPKKRKKDDASGEWPCLFFNSGFRACHLNVCSLQVHSIWQHKLLFTKAYVSLKKINL